VELQDSRSKTHQKTVLQLQYSVNYCRCLAKNEKITAETADIVLRFAAEPNLKYITLL